MTENLFVPSKKQGFQGLILEQLFAKIGLKVDKSSPISLTGFARLVQGKIRKTHEGFVYLANSINVENSTLTSDDEQNDVRTMRGLPSSPSTPERSPTRKKVLKSVSQGKENSECDRPRKAKKSLSPPPPSPFFSLFPNSFFNFQIMRLTSAAEIRSVM